MSSLQKILGVWLVAWGLGCSHARSVEPENEGSKLQSSEDKGHATPPEDVNARPPHSPAAGQAPPADKESRAQAELPIATSPAATLQPGAVKQIQEKLADKGALHEEHPSGELDGPTREALRRFQHDSDLPATGVPDDATVHKLGLDPDKTFKAQNSH
jgi:hypothetical protein